ncbi:MAG: general stress protein, partial [Chloroflexia bacterium]
MGTVVGLFDNTTQAQTAVQQLRNSGINSNDIGVAMRSTNTTGTTEVVQEGMGGAATGAMTGGALGGLAGLLVGIGAIAIPGIGPVVAAGPLGTALATTLVGAGIGAAAGGIIGALVDAGVPEEEARLYSTGVERGGVLVTAKVPAGQEQAALQILNSNGARDVNNDAANYNDPNWSYGKADDKGVGAEAAGGLGGAAAGALIGTAIAGPLGTGIGAVIGGAAGAGAGAMAEDTDPADAAGDTAGSGIGAGAGAATGAALGAIGGPVGMGVGAAIGAAVGGATGKATSDAAGDATEGTVVDHNYGTTTA